MGYASEHQYSTFTYHLVAARRLCRHCRTPTAVANSEILSSEKIARKFRVSPPFLVPAGSSDSHIYLQDWVAPLGSS